MVRSSIERRRSTLRFARSSACRRFGVAGRLCKWAASPRPATGASWNGRAIMRPGWGGCWSGWHSCEAFCFFLVDGEMSCWRGSGFVCQLRLAGMGFLLALLLFPAGSRGWLHGMALVLVVAWFCVGEVGNSTTGKSVIRCDCADKAWIVSSIDRDAGCDYAGGLARSYKRSPTPPRKPRVATTEARERRARACAGGRVPNPGTQSAGTGKQSCDNGQAAMCLSRLQQSEAGLPHMISHFLTCFPTFKMPQHVGQVAGRRLGGVRRLKA